MVMCYLVLTHPSHTSVKCESEDKDELLSKRYRNSPMINILNTFCGLLIPSLRIDLRSLSDADTVNLTGFFFSVTSSAEVDFFGNISP